MPGGKKKESQHWWTEYLGLKLDWPWVARKLRWAYLLYILPPLSALHNAITTETHVLPPSQTIAAHLPSPAVVNEGPVVSGESSNLVSINVYDSVSISVKESVSINKKPDTGQPEPNGGPSPHVITPLTGLMMIAGQGAVTASQSSV